MAGEASMSPYPVNLIAILIVVAALCSCAHVQESPPPAPSAACTPLPSSVSIGPAIALAQVEQESLSRLKTASKNVPHVPFGLQNEKWLALKRTMQPSDTIHRFCNDSSEGYLILRESCVVGRIVTMWY